MPRIAPVLFLISCAALAAAQDTNFSSGPQYLITSASPMFLRSIATPSLSLEPAPESATSAQTGNGAQPVPAPAVPAPPADVARVYWGDDWVRHVREEGAAPTAVNEIEISSPQNTPPLPRGFVEDGVTRITSVQSVLATGYGQSLGEVSAYWKAKRHAPRVYTNADIARLHGS